MPASWAACNASAISIIHRTTERQLCSVGSEIGCDWIVSDGAVNFQCDVVFCERVDPGDTVDSGDTVDPGATADPGARADSGERVAARDEAASFCDREAVLL